MSSEHPLNVLLWSRLAQFFAERDILTAFPEKVPARVGRIVGELHSVRSFELLGYLSRWFLIEIRKSFKSPLFMFSAKNRAMHTNEAEGGCL
jgi:hypothetical protein